MKPKVRAKALLHGGRIDLDAVRRARTFTEYDRCVTAPMFGFADERDYWARSSSRAILAGHPAPGAPDQRGQRSLRAAGRRCPEAEIAESPWLEAAFVPEGGHAGFLEGPWGRRRSWAGAPAAPVEPVPCAMRPRF